MPSSLYQGSGSLQRLRAGTYSLEVFTFIVAYGFVLSSPRSSRYEAVPSNFAGLGSSGLSCLSMNTPVGLLIKGFKGYRCLC